MTNHTKLKCPQVNVRKRYQICFSFIKIIILRKRHQTCFSFLHHKSVWFKLMPLPEPSFIIKIIILKAWRMGLK